LARPFFDEVEPVAGLADQLAFQSTSERCQRHQKSPVRPVHMSDTLRDHDAVLGQEAAHLIDQCGTRLNYLMSYAVNRPDVLLCGSLDHNKTH
jgi:hypothetical protein